MEWGALVAGYPLWWFVNPERTRWRLKADSKDRITRAWSDTYKYGFKCRACDLLIIDLVDPREVEGRQ